MIRQNIPFRYVLKQLSKSFSNESLLEKANTIRHEADTRHLVKIDNLQLACWFINACDLGTGHEALDELYTL